MIEKQTLRTLLLFGCMDDDDEYNVDDNDSGDDDDNSIHANMLILLLSECHLERRAV